MATAPDRVLLQVYPREARGREAEAVAERHWQDVHQDLVDEPPAQALVATSVPRISRFLPPAALGISTTAAACDVLAVVAGEIGPAKAAG